MDDLKYRDTVKEAIMQALVELMKERDISQISIKDIVARAGVGRSSFYRNFSSKEDILLQRIDTLFDGISPSRPLEIAHVREFMAGQFRVFKANQELLEVLQRNGMLYLLYPQTNRNARRLVDFHGLYRNPYQAAFFSGAGVSVLIQWVENGFRESEEELADMFIYLMDGRHREGQEK